MKIVIISAGFFESTFPLAKYLAINNDVTLICLVKESYLNPPMLDLSNVKILKRGVYDNDKCQNILPDEVKLYFKNSLINIQIVILGGMLGYDIKAIRRIKKIICYRYDVYHLIGQDIRFYQLHRMLKNKNVVHTLHEICISRVESKGKSLKKILTYKLIDYLGKSKTKLIFHSENTKNDFNLLYNKPQKLIEVIPFGKFEVYSMFKSKTINGLIAKKYFLYIGFIHPYKGVDLLIDAIKRINSMDISCDFVIAGYDKNNLYDLRNLPGNVYCINKYLSESEIVSLISNAYAIILPYKNVSQSGIPNTAFVFNRPVIASNISGLNDIIKENMNGLLFRKSDVGDLMEKIIELNNKSTLYKKLVENIEKNIGMEYMNWDKISLKTIKYYNLSITN